MNQLHVVWATFHPDAPNRGYWCTSFLEDLLYWQMEWLLAFDYINHESFATLPDGQGAVVIIPAEYNVDHVAEINAALARLPWSLVILVSDEGARFNPIDITHPNMRVWVMTPNRDRQQYHPGTHFIPEFAPGRTRLFLRNADRERLYDWSFSGQVTHVRRERCCRTLRHMSNGKLVETPGFAQGLTADDYAQLLANSKVIPAPSGTQTLDSFRLFEALEAGCVPVADLRSPTGTGDGPQYWNDVLGKDHPIETIQHWQDLPRIMPTLVNDWHTRSTEVSSWWLQFKRRTAYKLAEDVAALGGPTEERRITAIISTSPCRLHPSLDMIEETIRSIRLQPGLELIDIVITCDGVRAEQEYLRPQYEQYVRDLIHACNHDWENCIPVVHSTHQHQANTTRNALAFVRTPMILYVEHDTPLVTDEPIDWDGCMDLVESTEIDVLRFHYEARIPDVHMPLMLDLTPVVKHGVPIVRTVQFSQRPHIARTDWYRTMIDDHFPATSRTFIEDKIHGAAQDDPDRFKIAIYHPSHNIKRSLHTDGRGDEPKYAMSFT